MEEAGKRRDWFGSFRLIHHLLAINLLIVPAPHWLVQRGAETG